MSGTRRMVVFTAPRVVQVQEEALPPLAADQVLVRNECSAVSAGTELLLYRGQFPPTMPLDASIGSLSSAAQYPVRYGYAAVGVVEAVGNDVSQEWVGRRVFAFEPHQSHYVAQPASLIPLPAELSTQAAVFLPNIETAVSLVMDGRPMIGERVAVIGLGVVGLLTTALLRRHPLAQLAVFDLDPARRARGESVGADSSFDPAAAGTSVTTSDFDLVFELSGSPAALNTAVDLCGFASRVVVGSWYGTKESPVALGGTFHRHRLRIISSQVSTIAPELSGRWDKPRRLRWAMALAAELPCTQWITHRFPIAAAAEAYRVLDQQPESALQVVLQYD